MAGEDDRTLLGSTSILLQLGQPVGCSIGGRDFTITVQSNHLDGPLELDLGLYEDDDGNVFLQSTATPSRGVTNVLTSDA